MRTRRRRSPHRLVRAALAALALALVGGPLAHRADQVSAAASTADAARDARIARPAALVDVPAEPVAAARHLVSLIHRADLDTATAATAELLRRSAFPIVSIAGPVVALPDEGPLQDTEIYAELVPDLTRAVRRGSGYAPEDFASIVADLGLAGDGEEVPPDTLIAGLGVWGKAEDAPAASRFAGAAIRALSGIRRQVLARGTPMRNVVLDPLQTLIVAGHLTSRRGELAAVASAPSTGAAQPSPSPAAGLERLLGVGVARAAGDPCKELDNALKAPDQVQDTIKKAYTDQLKDAWKQMAPKPYRVFDVASKAWDKGSALTAVLLLLMGVTFDLNDDKGGITHYKHKPGDRSRHITMRATASFDSTLSQQYISCYKLAGLDVPKNGPLPGFRVRWRLNQPIIDRNLSNFLTGQGRHVVPVRADSRKIDACGSCGDTTSASGTSTLELTPRVEKTENPVGKVEKGKVTVVAALDKDEFPFKLRDFLKLKKPAQFAFDKLWDLAVAALKRAGLPNQTREIRVEYHQREIYVAKGETLLFALYYLLPIYLDIYTCEGIRGRWQGKGGFRADKIAFAQLLEKFAGRTLPQQYQQQADVGFSAHATAESFRFDIIPPFLNGYMEIDAPEDDLIQGIGNAGMVEIQIDENSVDPLAVFDPLGARYPIRRVDSDERCPDSGDAYFEDI